MLVSLHVKNFAIIDEVEVYFKDHLNILTGETGAGKSIIIGSINAALGAKVGRDILRRGADYALVELVFQTKDEEMHRVMKEMDLPWEDGMIIISRKIMPGRSISKINGENVTASAVSQIASLLIDIHGQHEHQSLLNKAKHLEIVDRFAKDEIGSLKEELELCYQDYMKFKKEYDQAGIDEEKRLREISFLEYEVNEIKSAQLVLGEDEELELSYKKLSNANTIAEGLQAVYRMTGYETSAAGDTMGRALRQLMKLAEYDDRIPSFLNQAKDIEDILNDFNRDLSEYISDMENPEEELDEVAKRLDFINHLKSKYGGSLEQIIRYGEECEKKLEKYQDYDAYMQKLGKSLADAETKLKNRCEKLSQIRKKQAKILTDKIKKALISLNFLEVKFEMTFERTKHYSANGYDDAEFIISTNPGEALRPLSKVASGGELSRIMLGIKSVLAQKDDIETMIFDEIDTGISGRTAQKVSEQLANIAGSHQIICITHLAQIAAMADSHYLIEKKTDGMTTQTTIEELNPEESIDELSRILGGAEITDRVRESAKEMKELAETAKKLKR
ncbi:MAG TPA: DNA repair protein RecN [Lachnospiraceae bacterium]|nr:DNA repair protein RecN [Lachnospiraceae bacterium]